MTDQDTPEHESEAQAGLCCDLRVSDADGSRKRSSHLKRADANADGKVPSLGALMISIFTRNAGGLEEYGGAS